MTTQTERTCGRFVLVGCGDAKADNPVEARNLYTSSYFAAKRSLAEAAVQWARTADRRANSWSILSAEHAILMPRQTVAPYDTTIEDLRGEPIEGEPPYRLPSGDRAETQGLRVLYVTADGEQALVNEFEARETDDSWKPPKQFASVMAKDREEVDPESDWSEGDTKAKQSLEFELVW